jgi:hypothetical protein
VFAPTGLLDFPVLGRERSACDEVLRQTRHTLTQLAQMLGAPGARKRRA